MCEYKTACVVPLRRPSELMCPPDVLATEVCAGQVWVCAGVHIHVRCNDRMESKLPKNRTGMHFLSQSMQSI